MLFMRVGVVCLGALVSAAVMPAQEDLIAQALQRARAVTNVHAGQGSYLGVGLGEVTEERARAINLKDPHGAEVKVVEENSPAAKAGLKTNDVILEYNGQRVEGVEQFIRFIGETPAGRKVNLTVLREGSRQTVAATLEARKGMVVMGAMPAMPPVPPMPPEFSDLQKRLGEADSQFTVLTMNNRRAGIEWESLGPQLAEFFGVKQGVLVRSVAADSPGGKAGLKAGDVITKINGTPVMSSREVNAMFAKGKVTLTVVRNKREMSIDVEV